MFIFGGLAALLSRAVKFTSYDTMTQKLVEEAEDRCTGRGRDPFNSFVWCEGLARAISEQRGEQNDGMRRAS